MIARSLGPKANLQQLTLAAVRLEFPGCSDQLHQMMFADTRFITAARNTNGTPVSQKLALWFDIQQGERSNQFTARVPEIDTLLLISRRLGSLVKGYQPRVTDSGCRSFVVPHEDLRSPHSIVVAVVPIPDF